jgi:hypothetical protein
MRHGLQSRCLRSLARVVRPDAMTFIILKSIIQIGLLYVPVLLLQPACDSSTEALPPGLADVCAIHLQSGFFHAPVRVSVDFSQVFEDTVTTGLALAVAAVIPVQVFNGPHLLNVTVAGSVSKDTTFTIADTLYIGVNYDATTSRIAYSFRRMPFYYR